MGVMVVGLACGLLAGCAAGEEPINAVGTWGEGGEGEPQQALELLLDKLKKTRNNVEFLMQIQKTTPGSNGND